MLSDDPGGRGPGSQQAVGARFAAVFALSVLALGVVAVSAFASIGSASRWSPPKERVTLKVDSSRELLAAWEKAGVRNAVLVEASDRLGFQTVPFGAEVRVPNSYPFPVFHIRDAFPERVRRENVLWVAANRGLFRTIHYVFTPEDLASLVQQGRAAGLPDISPDGSSITPNNNGYLRRVSSSFPRLREPVVLSVDASYFVEGEPRALADAVRASGLDVRVLSLGRAADDTATTEAARARLEEFGRLMQDRR